MMRLEELVDEIADLQRGDLEAWIRDELVAPTEESGALHFTQMECARIRLICTLRYELEVEAETLPVVLSLIDQLYETRQQLRALAAAVTGQDRTVQDAIVAALDGDGEAPAHE